MIVTTSDDGEHHGAMHLTPLIQMDYKMQLNDLKLFETMRQQAAASWMDPSQPQQQPSLQQSTARFFDNTFLLSVSKVYTSLPSNGLADAENNPEMFEAMRQQATASMMNP